MIRMATEKDIPTICKLLAQVNLIHHLARPDVFKKGLKYSEEELKLILKDQDRPIFVHEDSQGEIDGYCFCIIKNQTASNLLEDMKTLYIDDLCVDEDKRRSGVGTLLFNQAQNFAKKIGCHNLTLNVWSCNPSALKFYQKLGLLPQKTIMEKLL